MLVVLNRRNAVAKQGGTENMVYEERMNKWPLSNYPILTAAVLLVTMAIALMLGESDAYANQLAIYAYILLVTGVAIKFFEFTLPETLIQRLKVKLPKLNRNENSLEAERDNALDFFAEVTRNVSLSLLVFSLIILSYGVLVDWSPVEWLIKQLGYVIIIFLALHLLLRVRL